MIAMKDQIIKLAGVVLTCAVISACSDDVENAPPLNSGPASNGNADFTTFVSIGDSLTAGYADGALYLLGQQNSFPKIMSEKFSEVGGGNFVQPLLAHDPLSGIDGNIGGLLVGGVPDVIKNRFVLNTETQLPERLETPLTTILQDVVGTNLNGTAFNNMGVPAAKSFNLGEARYGNPNDLALGTANPYFVRFATTNGTTMIDDAAAQAPSFYTLWIGANDVIWYGFSGGTGAVYGVDQFDITDPATFAIDYPLYVEAFDTANPGVQGVLINIPDVTTIAYFTAVPYNAVPLEQADADALNAAYAPYNAGLQAVVGLVPNFTQEEADARTITFAAGQNALVIMDKDLTDLTGANAALVNMRQATAGDRIVFESAPKIGTEAVPGDETTVWGVGMPLLDADVLIPSEVKNIKTATDAYNATIKAAADADPNLILYDAETLFAELNANGGFDYGNGSVNADFATGGFFSLDGIHPTARGYAVLSNQIIDAINAGFAANVHKVDPGEYPTVFLK